MHCTVLFTRYVCPGPVDELAEMLAVCNLISLNPTTYEEVSNRWKSSRCLRSRKWIRGTVADLWPVKLALHVQVQVQVLVQVCNGCHHHEVFPPSFSRKLEDQASDRKNKRQLNVVCLLPSSPTTPTQHYRYMYLRYVGKVTYAHIHDSRTPNRPSGRQALRCVRA